MFRNTGTVITDHFIVLDKTPRSIILRGGSLNTNDLDKPRDMEHIAEVRVDIKSEKETAEFRFKNVFFAGTTGMQGSSFPRPIVWIHLQYCKLLVEAGVSRCVQ